MDSGKDTSEMGTTHGRFGGPVYAGPPALSVTAALVKAGGGAANFSTAKALVAMLGADTVNAEVANLSKQYDKDEVNTWLKTFDFAVADSLKIATAAGISLPDVPEGLSGAKLARTLVTAGTASDNTFQIEFLLDKAVSHGIHVQVMNDIDANKDLGKLADLRYHQISNQAFYDVAQALGMTTVKLSDQH
jgi:LPS O-antigen subunit length determinant protein (WzzB/FepE family)